MCFRMDCPASSISFDGISFRTTRHSMLRACRFCENKTSSQQHLDITKPPSAPATATQTPLIQSRIQTTIAQIQHKITENQQETSIQFFKYLWDLQSETNDEFFINWNIEHVWHKYSNISDGVPLNFAGCSSLSEIARLMAYPILVYCSGPSPLLFDDNESMVFIFSDSRSTY
jgi:hypothetical protein